MAGDRLEDPQARFVEGGEQLEEGVAERLHLFGPDVGRHLRFIGMARRKLAADVPEFLEVEIDRALGGLDPERRVAAGAAAALDLVAALHLVRQSEEGLGLLLGAVDQVGRYAVIGDDREAVALERFPELRGEPFGIGCRKRRARRMRLCAAGFRAVWT